MGTESAEATQPCSCCEEDVPLGGGTRCSSQPPPNAEEYKWAPNLLCSRCFLDMKQMVSEMGWPSHTSPDGGIFWFEKPRAH